MDTPEGGTGGSNQPGKILPLNYKYREVKIHSSDEWMAGSTKKYRVVYDRFETTYMRAEFSFFNKLFDEEDWEGTLRLRCCSIYGSARNELCNFEEKRKISKDENIVYFRYSWGNAIAGDYWRKGTYVWEAYVDSVMVGEGKFYVEDVGPPKVGENLYFDVESIRMFEGASGGASSTDRKYASKFSQKDTRYIFSEFIFKNKTAVDYYIELLFNFSDSDGQPKGSHPYLIYVPVNTAGTLYTAYASWGSDTPGTWKNDTYWLEVVFNDELVASVPFEVGDQFQEGQVEVLTDIGQVMKRNTKGTAGTPSKSNEVILAESLAELDSMTGLHKIKAEVNEMVRLVQYYQETGKDVLNKFSLHTVFTGNPGTGKTTVARLLSKIYKGLGILEKGHLVEVDREGLVAGYVGQTAIKTAEKITESMGGILFIDEAYSLAGEKGSPYDFGGESIQVILKRMEDMRGKFGVIVAGYTANMHSFINSNPGLKSRFDKYFVFDDYTPDEMFIIALSMFRHEDVMPDVDAATHLKKYFNFLYEGRDAHFGNARTVRQTVLESVKNQNLRLAMMPKDQRTQEMMATVIYEDVKEFEMVADGYSHTTIGFKNKPT